jgi:hypothetical protein
MRKFITRTMTSSMLGIAALLGMLAITGAFYYHG